LGRARIFQDATRQDQYRAHVRHAAGSTLNTNKTCGQGVVSLCMGYLFLCVTIFWDLATRFCTCIFSKHLCFTHLRVFALLSGVSFLSISKMIGLCKLFAKLGYCRTLWSFLRGQVINCSQRSYIILLSKLTPGAAKPPTCPEGVLPMGPRSANGGPPCISLVP
jgi:hypothetical protein